MKRYFLSLLLGFLLVGCGSTSYYTFDEIEVSNGYKKTYSKEIGVAKISLPAYLKQNKIVIQTAENKLAFLKADEWVDSPDILATQTVINYLNRMGSGAKVSAYPWGFNAKSGHKITINLSKFIAFGDEVVLESTYSIENIENSKSQINKNFKTTVPTEIKNSDSVVKSMNQALFYLAKDIHQNIL